MEIFCLGFSYAVFSFSFYFFKHFFLVSFLNSSVSAQLPNVCICQIFVLSPLNIPAAAAKLLQSYPALCDAPIDGRPPGSSIPGILQARILEWVAISFSNACMHAKSLQLCLTLCDPMDSSPPGSSVHRIL